MRKCLGALWELASWLQQPCAMPIKGISVTAPGYQARSLEVAQMSCASPKMSCASPSAEVARLDPS